MIKIVNDGSFYLRNAEIKIEFLSPELGRGSSKAFYIKNLSLRTIPLRYLDILLEDRITVKEDNIEIAIPAPLNFSLHKLLIAQRRKNKDKIEKDITQAIFTKTNYRYAPLFAVARHHCLPRAVSYPKIGMNNFAISI